MKTAIITGISGQDGKYLAKFLLKKAYKIIGLTRNIQNVNYDDFNFLGIKSDINFIQVDELSVNFIENLLETHKPSEVYNLASQSSVSLSFVNELDTVSYNLLSTIKWLNVIKTNYSDIKFFQASSSEIFGNYKEMNLPISIRSVFSPISPYGVSKAAAHWTCVNYREMYNTKVSSGILFNHESVFRSKDFVIKKIISTAVEIKIRGVKKKLFVGDTSIIRDWGYAPFYIEAFWLSLNASKLTDNLICSGNKMSLEEFISYVFTYLNLVKEDILRRDIVQKRPSEIKIIYGSNTETFSSIGWKYQLTNKQLVERLVDDEIKYQEWNLSKR